MPNSYDLRFKMRNGAVYSLNNVNNIEPMSYLKSCMA